MGAGSTRTIVLVVVVGLVYALFTACVTSAFRIPLRFFVVPLPLSRADAPFWRDPNRRLCFSRWITELAWPGLACRNAEKPRVLNKKANGNAIVAAIHLNILQDEKPFADPSVWTLMDGVLN